MAYHPRKEYVIDHVSLLPEKTQAQDDKRGMAQRIFEVAGGLQPEEIIHLGAGIMGIHSKQIRALKHAIQTLEKERRRFSVGHLAYTQQGIRPDPIKAEGVTGTAFDWVETDHRHYEECEQDIQELNDLIEILEDPGVIYSGGQGLPLFDFEDTDA